MAVVDFSDSAQMLQPLDLKLGDRIYEVRPTADDLASMLRMRRAISASLNERARAEEAAKAKKVDPPEARPLVEFLDDADRIWTEDDVALSCMQLGTDTYEQMIADGVPFPNIRRMADYSYNYHVGGPEYANAMLAIRDKAATTEDEDEDAGAEFPKRSKSGRSTASGNRTKTGSTAGTGRSRSTSAKSSTRTSTGRKK